VRDACTAPADRPAAGDPDHGSCIVCGTRNPSSLRLRFDADGEGGVTGRFRPSQRLQGYADRVHGGVVAAVMDAAMTHCLFLHGVRAVTADLHVRYIAPVPCGSALTVTGRLVSSGRRLYRLSARVTEGDRVLATADASFVPRR
jgi:uncharacterized protein (TIGR00369 family)